MSSSVSGETLQSSSAQANRGNEQRPHTTAKHRFMLAQHVDTGPELLLYTWRFVQICSFMLINQTVKGPYMDEKFHVPQAILYCNDKFSTYDPKLTTPPGIYLLSYLLHRIGVPCNITYLRSLNLFIGTFLLPRVCMSIYRTLHPSSSRSEIRWSGSLAAMPILSFFSLLYYTDLASTYTLLLAFDMLLTNYLWTASLVWSFDLEQFCLINTGGFHQPMVSTNECGVDHGFLWAYLTSKTGRSGSHLAAGLPCCWHWYSINIPLNFISL